MPQSVYTRQLVGIHKTALGVAPVYQVPEGQVVVIRDLVLFNYGPGAQHLQVALLTGGEYCPLVDQAAVPEFGVIHLDLRQAIEAGDEIYLRNDTVPCSLLVTGYVFPS